MPFSETRKSHWNAHLVNFLKLNILYWFILWDQFHSQDKRGSSFLQGLLLSCLRAQWLWKRDTEEKTPSAMGWCCPWSRSTYLGRTMVGQRRGESLPRCVDFVKMHLVVGGIGCSGLLASGLPSLFSFASLFPRVFFSTSFILPHDSPFISHLPNNRLGPFRKYLPPRMGWDRGQTTVLET